MHPRWISWYNLPWPPVQLTAAYSTTSPEGQNRGRSYHASKCSNRIMGYSSSIIELFTENLHWHVFFHRVQAHMLSNVVTNRTSHKIPRHTLLAFQRVHYIWFTHRLIHVCKYSTTLWPLVPYFVWNISASRHVGRWCALQSYLLDSAIALSGLDQEISFV